MEPDKSLELEQPAVVETPEAETTQTPEYTPDEQAAMAKGWKPKDQWEGPEDEWKPAKVFNEIGSLKESLAEREREIKKANKVVQLMKDHHLNVRKTAIEEAIKTLKAQRQEALSNENFAEAEVLRDRIDDIRQRADNQRVLPPEIESQIEEQQLEPDPEFFKFLDRNPWYKPGGKDDMSREADDLGAAFKLRNPDATFSEVIADVEKKMKKLHPEKFERPRNPVNEPGARTSANTGSKVRLSEEQRAIARGFGMTDEQYAKELDSYKGR